MKRTNYVYYVLVCMLLCFTACDKDKSSIEDEIPAAIKSDFSTRYPSVKITAFQNLSNGLDQIDFLDKEQNEASISYVNEIWKMTSTKINDIDQLPAEVQNTFRELRYYDPQNLEICKTERDGMEKSLYTLHFQYLWKGSEHMEHYVFINDDGLYLTTVRWKPNDTRWYPGLPKDHFDFIADKYKGAEIRGYMNDGGYHVYFILHENIIKFVTFRGEVATDREFWTETRYELSKDAKIPENVIKVLNQEKPDFTYTHVYYVESKEGNSYLLQDKNRDDELGYYIGENRQPADVPDKGYSLKRFESPLHE